MKKKVKEINIDGNINKKICLISDIHFYRNYNLKIFDIIEKNIKANKPDYICIPGDIIDIPNLEISKLKPLYDFLTRLGSICKVFISLGNHDLSVDHSYYYNEPYIKSLSSIKNVFLLANNEYIDKNIRFIGIMDNVNVSHKEHGLDNIIIKDYNNLFKMIDIKDNKYNILLAHNPIYLVKKETTKKIDDWSYISLVLSGHTHGGLMPEFIKTHYGIVSPAKRLLPKNIRGKFCINGTNIIISNGVVKLSYCAGVLHKFNFLFPISIDYINIK